MVLESTPPPRGVLTPEAYGEAMRELAYEAAEVDAINLGLAVAMTEITDSALRAWHDGCQPQYEPGAPGAHWNWTAEARKLRANPYRFEVALWREGVLCGLAIGSLSKNRRVLNLALLARCPGADNPLRGYVLGLVDSVAEAYAKVWGCNWLRVKKPLKEIYGLYADLGFALVEGGSNGPYFEREVAYEDRD